MVGGSAIGGRLSPAARAQLIAVADEVNAGRAERRVSDGYDEGLHCSMRQCV